MTEPENRAPRGRTGSGLLELERRFAELAREVETLDPVERNARLGRIERDLCAFQCELARAEGAREHPVLSVALGWEERLRRAGDHDAGQAVEKLAAEILIRGLRSRERAALDVLELGPSNEGGVAEETRDRLFDGLVAVEELRQRVEGRAGALGVEGEADARAVCEEAGKVQLVLREALVRACELVPPTAAVRRQWTGKLVDLADETILGAGERNPRISARQLGEASRAIRWHVANVETGPSDQRRRLKRRERRVNAERIEQQLQAKLEARFGARAVELWERGIFVALLAVVGLLVIDLTQGSNAWVLWIDTGLCALFLVDFFVKATMVGFHPTWLKRHFLTDLVPAIPFAWIASLDSLAADTGRLGRLLRLVRIVKVAQYLRVALPIIRMFRALSFLVRGLDRLVRRNTRLLESEVLLFPTPLERRRSREARGSIDARLWRVRGDVDGMFEQLFEEAERPERDRIASLRLSALRDASRAVVEPRDSGSEGTKRRLALPLADRWLRRMSTVRSEEVEGRVGTEAVRRIARGARLVARSPLRYAFLLGRWAPADAADLPDRRVASRTVRNVSRSLSTLHHRVLWWADLRGTLTPGELVGRVGSTLVARTARPAFRLLMLGGLYLILELAIQLLGLDVAPVDATQALDAAERVRTSLPLADAAAEAPARPPLLLWIYLKVKPLVEGALALVGSVCLAILALGVWLQRMARDATTFHERVARAQFLHLTDSIKARQRVLDGKLLAERVFRPERNLFEADGAREAAERDEARFIRHLERFLSEGTSPPSRNNGFDPVARAVMLHRDLLDGALLAHSDTRATSQLLGNLAVQRMIRQSSRISKSLTKSIVALDLERRRTFLRGPYLWFHSISHALSSRAARLIVDYNAHAIPVGELDRAGAEERQRYEHWLTRSLSAAEETAEEDEESHDAPQISTAFTVLHFLDDAPARDQEVATRFGDAVLARMQEDRRALVRTVFGTYPLHRMPLESRVLNLRALYAEWIEGGRVLFVPLRVLWLGGKLGVSGLRGVFRAVATIRKPELALGSLRDSEADFTAAARKIGRMRGPGAQASLHIRAILDVEYHGIALPFGLYDHEESDVSTRSPAMRDADFLDAEPSFVDRVSALEARAQRNVGRLERAAEAGLLERIGEKLGVEVREDPATLRALVTLVHADEGGIRSRLFGLEILCEATVDALEFGLPSTGILRSIPVWLSFRTWWEREGGEQRVTEAVRASGVVAFEPDAELVTTPSATKAFHRALKKRIRRAAWRSVLANTDGARDALAEVRRRATEGETTETTRDRGETKLVDALRHPARVTEQLLTLRTIQTLSLVDVRNYRRHVWSIGQYATEGDTGGVKLDVAPE